MMDRPYMRRAGAILMALICIGVSAAAAQTTSAASADATLTVVSTPVAVSPFSDLLFGTHFASDGLVADQQAAEFEIGGPPGAVISLEFTMLPSALVDGGGHSVALSYGTTSLTVTCDDGAGNVVPLSGSPGTAVCLMPSSGSALLQLGNGADVDGYVHVDLTGAPDGTYTGVIELTATIN